MGWLVMALMRLCSPSFFGLAFKCAIQCNSTDDADGSNKPCDDDSDGDDANGAGDPLGDITCTPLGDRGSGNGESVSIVKPFNVTACSSTGNLNQSHHHSTMASA